MDLRNKQEDSVFDVHLFVFSLYPLYTVYKLVHCTVGRIYQVDVLEFPS